MKCPVADGAADRKGRQFPFDPDGPHPVSHQQPQSLGQVLPDNDLWKIFTGSEGGSISLNNLLQEIAQKVGTPWINTTQIDTPLTPQIALQQNLALMAADIGVDIARDDVRIARSGYLPTLDLVARRQVQDISGNGKNTAQNFTSGLVEIQPIDTLNDSTAEVISVQFSVPIYTGGAIRSASREAVWQRRAALERLERTAREVERQTRDSYLGVISEVARVKALRQSLKSSRTALQATEAGFEVGTRTTVDVLDSRRSLFLAETNYARSRYDYIINVLLLKEAAGTLTETDLTEVNGWLE